MSTAIAKKNAPKNVTAFSNGCSFNTHDTHVSIEDGRIRIDQSKGVRLRCELVIHALVSAGANGLTLEETVAKVNKKVARGNVKYSDSDIQYALKRLCSFNVVKRKDGVFKATTDLYAKWKATYSPKKLTLVK